MPWYSDLNIYSVVLEAIGLWLAFCELYRPQYIDRLEKRLDAIAEFNMGKKAKIFFTGLWGVILNSGLLFLVLLAAALFVLALDSLAGWFSGFKSWVILAGLLLIIPLCFTRFRLLKHFARSFLILVLATPLFMLLFSPLKTSAPQGTLVFSLLLFGLSLFIMQRNAYHRVFQKMIFSVFSVFTVIAVVLVRLMNKTPEEKAVGLLGLLLACVGLGLGIVQIMQSPS